MENSLEELKERLGRLEKSIDTHRALLRDLEERCEYRCGRGRCNGTKRCEPCTHQGDIDHLSKTILQETKEASELRDRICKLIRKAE